MLSRALAKYLNGRQFTAAAARPASASPSN
jgi:hypothetical protein